MNEQYVTEELVRKVIKNMIIQFLGANEDFVRRETDVFFSDGYDELRNRTVFFCVKGSPNKFFGFMRPHQRDSTVGAIWDVVSNRGTFRTDFLTIWKRASHKPQTAIPLE